MDLNSILESISKEQTKPRLKERPLSESEIIRAYSIITEERYNLIAEDSRMKINELLSYGEESDDDIKEAEKYNPNPARKMKTALGRAWTIIKKLIKALINILKSLIQIVLNVFKKKKKDIEDAVEVEIQTYNDVLQFYNHIIDNKCAYYGRPDFDNDILINSLRNIGVPIDQVKEHLTRFDMFCRMIIPEYQYPISPTEIKQLSY